MDGITLLVGSKYISELWFISEGEGRRGLSFLVRPLSLPPKTTLVEGGEYLSFLSVNQVSWTVRTSPQSR